MQLGKTKPTNPMTFTREYALQFLYQCEIERIYYFDEGRFKRFAEHFNMNDKLLDRTEALVKSVLDDMPAIDEVINTVSEHWKISRMSAIDRNVLRISYVELSAGQTPKKVVINEGVNLAKLYGTEKSGSFVNGLLDRLAKESAFG